MRPGCSAISGNGYYDLQKKGIWRVPASGGPETLVPGKEIYPHNWDLTDRGIYLIDGGTKIMPNAMYFIDGGIKPVATICFYNFATRSIRNLASVHSDPSFGVSEGLCVSPDGKWLLYSGGFWTSDTMMIEDFR